MKSMAVRLYSALKRGYRLLIITAIFLFVLILILAFHFGHQHKTNHPPATVLINQINRDVAVGEYQKALDSIYQAGQQDKPIYQGIIASIYIKQKKYNEALSIYSRLDQNHNINRDMAESAASLSQTIGKTAQAIHYYNVVINLIKAEHSDPVKFAEIKYYNQQISALEGQK